MILPLHRSFPRHGGQATNVPATNAFGSLRAIGLKTWKSPLITRVLLITFVCLFTLWWLPGTVTLRASDELGGNIVEESFFGSIEVPDVWYGRAEEVKKSFVRVYHSYERVAFGFDEMSPVSNGSLDNFNGWGVTIIDSLSTMVMMDLHDEYNRGIAHVATLNFTDTNLTISFFETVIRYLGGILSAHALTGNEMLLAQADNLGGALIGAFNTLSGLPSGSIIPATGTVYGMGQSLLAEIASCQMEFKYLAHLTRKPEYFLKSDKVIDLMENALSPDGLYATYWNLVTGEQVPGQTSIGASADSAYEYLLKGYLLSGRSEKRLLDMYLKSVNGVIDRLMYISPTRNLLYVTDEQNDYQPRVSHNLEHLSCFYPGLLALGLQTLKESELPARDAERHRWAAEGLAHTCWLQYAESATGLGPERSFFSPSSTAPRLWVDAIADWEADGRKGGISPPGVKGPDPIDPWVKGWRDYEYSDPRYNLRPETIETIYVMWRYTGDIKWRDRGWKIYEAIERYTKTPSAYGEYWDIAIKDSNPIDHLPSFFLAETLKYLYLLFSDETRSLPADLWIFNTEAHPLPVFHWSDWEKNMYNISRQQM